VLQDLEMQTHMEMAITYFSGDVGFNCKMTMNKTGNAG